MARLRIMVAALALVGVTLQCNTPSIPLPPPLLPALSFADATGGMVTMVGKPEAQHANTRFYVFNRSRGDGVITTAGADGAFTTSPFPGADGDTVQIYYDNADTTRSAEICVALKLNAQLLSGPCR
jgi:hypothetical protein